MMGLSKRWHLWRRKRGQMKRRREMIARTNRNMRMVPVLQSPPPPPPAGPPLRAAHEMARDVGVMLGASPKPGCRCVWSFNTEPAQLLSMSNDCPHHSPKKAS